MSQQQGHCTVLPNVQASGPCRVAGFIQTQDDPAVLTLLCLSWQAFPCGLSRLHNRAFELHQDIFAAPLTLCGMTLAALGLNVHDHYYARFRPAQHNAPPEGFHFPDFTARDVDYTTISLLPQSYTDCQ